MPRMQINPDDFKRAKLVKPGWFPTLIKDVTEEMNAKKDAMNSILDCENADAESEYMGVPVKCWISEKAATMPGGLVTLVKAFNPKIDETKMADVELNDYKGKYIYAKWETFRGKDGTDPPRNVIVDWAPLPTKYAHLVGKVVSKETDAVAGFGV